MVFYIDEPDHYVTRISAQDFVNFNMAEEFDHSPSNAEIISFFRDLPIKLFHTTDVDELTEAVRQACLHINGLSIKEAIAKLNLDLMAKIEPTSEPIEEADEYDFYDMDDFRTLWP